MRPVLLALVLLAVAAACTYAADPTVAAAGVASIADDAVAPPEQEQQQQEQQQQQGQHVPKRDQQQHNNQQQNQRQEQQQRKQQQRQQGPSQLEEETLFDNEASMAPARALNRAGVIIGYAQPAPHYVNYSLAASRDTFEICRNQSGLAHDISLEGLLPIYGLPNELLASGHVSTETLMRVLSVAAPTVRLVIVPLLAGEGELSQSKGRLPRLVHFTVRDKGSMLPHQALSIASWAVINPGYSVMIYDDDDIAGFMAAHHPRLLPLFHRLGSQVERTDMWRYLVLCTFGGVYADSDVVAGRPISTWAQDAGLLTGIENVFANMDAARRRDYTRVMQMTQWTIAARPGHPVVCRMGDYIQRHLDKEESGEIDGGDRDHAILERTGPGIWSSSVHDYVREHGVDPEVALVGGGKVGDVRLLPQSTFGCASNIVNLDDHMAYVYHMFKGSWRLHEPEKLWQFFTKIYAHLFHQPHHSAAHRRATASPALDSTGTVRAGGGSGPQDSVERRLHEQLPHARLQAMGGHYDAAADHSYDESLHLLPLASILAVGALICSAIAQRSSGKCPTSPGGTRPWAAVRQSASNALGGAWAGRRWDGAGRGSNGGLLGSGGGAAASLLPLSQGPGKGAVGLDRPLLSGSAAVSTSTRQQGAAAGCLKRSAGSMQCLQSGAGMQ